MSTAGQFPFWSHRLISQIVPFIRRVVSAGWHMDEEAGKKEEEKLEFTNEGEALGYISLDQARVLALQHARDNRELHGRYADQELTWEVIGTQETEDYYEVRLSYLPVQGFTGK